ncbi:PaaI family thioesterase [Phoenicibacter congonensis]|uniref:PaaI family thioesterase n=1 Tax=Phoenicibacter congonensis TaxID=1944646 RepID=UPI0009A63EF7|nr:PaaI family thioesterase [Phoenicibacter congonensis]
MLFTKDATLEDVQKKFSNDHFANDVVGCRLTEVGVGHSVCEFDIEEKHLNEKGSVMGGAIFTLADFAIVTASAIEQDASVSVNINIEYLSAPKGKKLIAEANVDKEGRRLGFYRCLITDDLDRKIARVTATIAHV